MAKQRGKKSSPVSRYTRNQTSAALQRLAGDNGYAAIAHATGTSASTVRRWARGEIPAESLSRARTTLVNADTRLTVKPSEIKPLRQTLARIDKMGAMNLAAAQSHHSKQTFVKYLEQLESGKMTRAEFGRIYKSVGDIRTSSEKLRDDIITRANKDGTKRRIGHSETYKGILTPKEDATAYRLFGRDADGKIRWSTTLDAKFDSAANDAAKKAMKYKSVEWEIELVYLDNEGDSNEGEE